jgi:CRISPR/Cas system-associated endonuclease Cas1
MVADGLKVKTDSGATVTSPPYLPYDTVVIQNAYGYASFAALRILLSQRVSIALLDWQGHLLGHIAPYAPRRGDRWMLQLKAASDPKKRLAIAKGIVSKGYRRRGMNPPVASVGTIRELVYLESRIAESYWNAWRKRLTEAWPQNDFDGRVHPRYPIRRRAVTRVNCVLNYSYALLESACRTACFHAGLHPEVGFLHAEMEHKEPLVFDLQELGRAWVDEAVLDWFKKPDNRTGFVRTAEWAARLAPEKAGELAAFIGPRIQNAVLWRDAQAIVRRL